MKTGLKNFILPAAAALPFFIFVLLAVIHRSEGKLFPDRAVQAAQTQKHLNSLTQSMRLWSSLNWDEKEQIVSMVILYFRAQHNTAILNDPAFYVKQLDRFLETNPGGADKNIMTLVQFFAVLESDFFDGQDREKTAQRVLGPKLYADTRRQLKLRRDYLNKTRDGNW